jgi:pimeloyl-ACP methyl ester carboxylesterase
MLLANLRKASYSQYTIVANDLDMFKRKGQRPMRKVLPLLVGCGFMFLLAGSQHAAAQKQKLKGQYDPPGNLEPPAEVLQQIKEKTAQLAAKIAELRKHPKHHELLPDVEIYLRAAENIVRFKEFYNKASGQSTLDCLDRGLQRAEQLATGRTPWTTLENRNVLRAYRSGIDGTAQPYGVTYPLDYGKDPKRKWRVDVVLHGRNSSLTEVAFLNSHNGNKLANQDWVQIDIYGRGNSAYRWAGETDVLEAMEAFFANEAEFGSGHMPDRRRVVLRGFSMGGAGTWHLGLHHPDRWCVIGPGAGFTTTHNYAWKGKKDLPDYQEKCLRIYDAIDYVENARMIPIVAYSGGDDPQKLAADNIENRLKELKIDAMTHLVKPGAGHKLEPDYFAKANALWSKAATKGRPDYPSRVSFVTYTMMFRRADWVEVLALEKHYEKASVDGEFKGTSYRVTTANVRALALGLPAPLGMPGSGARIDVQIDGQPLKGISSPYRIVLLKESGRWRTKQTGQDWTNEPAKTWRLQGPIDDAFTWRFVCVLGSGETWHPATKKYVDAKLAAFKYDWAKHWRGELPTIGDYAVTPNDIMDKNLILFGDPSSNLTLAQIMPKLPLQWTKDEIEFAGKKYKASEHVPVLIFPNPLNPRRYVVLNTGHTFPSEDYSKTNALLFPRLGDYAILRMTPTAKNAAAYEVATAGLFDEFWRIEKK